MWNISVMYALSFSTTLHMEMKTQKNATPDSCWLRFICSISALRCSKWRCCLVTMNADSLYSAEDSEMLETFKQMGPLLNWDRYGRPDDDRDNKKAKKNKQEDEQQDGEDSDEKSSECW